MVALKREEDIRNHIEAWLKQQGIAVEREVICGNGIRADLVTSDTVIEIKKQLTRGAIYQAHGQGVTYQKLLNKPKLLIIGLAPPSDLSYQAAQRIAENVRTKDVEVIFLDKDSKWEKTMASIAVPADKSAAKKPTGEPRPSVQLPFEKPAVAAAMSGAASSNVSSKDNGSSKESAQAETARSPRIAGPTSKDIWALLLIILLFLWVKAAGWRNENTEEFETQPGSELTAP